ncbi:MAG: amidohydrolase family protein [Phycisphaerales bacterium]
MIPAPVRVARVVVTVLLPFALLAALAARVAGQATSGPLRQPTNGVVQVEPGWHAIINARVTTEPGQVLEKATIVVRHGAIVSVGNDPPPAGARVWDATGLNVYPGLVEPYLTVEAPRPDKAAPGSHWNPRITPERTALDGPGVPQDAVKRLRSMGYGAALIAPSGGILRGVCALHSLSDPLDPNAPGVERIVTRLQAQAASFETGGFGDDSYPSSKMGAIAVLRQTLVDAQWQNAATQAFSREPGSFERPPFTTALETLRQPTGWVFDAGDSLDIVRFAKIISEMRGQERVIAVGTGAEYQRLEAIRRSAAAIVVPLAFPKKPRVSTAPDRDSVGLNELIHWEQAPTNPRRLADANVFTAITTSKLPKGADFMDNLRDAVTAGLSKDRALAMITTNPAALVGMTERLGKVQPGFIANFIVMKGEFFDPPSGGKREIRDVWIDGQRYEINPAPSPAGEMLKGDWTLSAATAPALSLTLKIGEKNEVSLERPGLLEAEPAPAPEGEKKPEPKKPASVKAKGVVQIENRLDFTASATTFDPNFKPAPPAEKPADKPPEAPGEAQPGEVKPEEAKPDAADTGAALVSLILDTAKADALRGSVTLPTGQTVALTAVRKGDAEKKDADKKDDDNKPRAALLNIPEALTTPFGAYGLSSIPEQQTVLISNVTVWTNGADGIIENGAVLIEKGKIAAVGKSPLAGIAKPDREIDGKGLHLTAGIIDCHSHTGISGGVNEGTQSCTAEVRIFDVINPDDVDWYRQLAGGVTAVNQLHGSANAIGGQNSVVKLRWGCAAPDDMRVDGAPPGIKFALGENVKQANWGERFTTRYPQTRMGVETYIRDRFIAARAYKARLAAYQALGAADQAKARPPERDLELEALVEILDGKRLIHCHSYRQDEILMLCRVAAEFGFKVGTFQHVLEGYKVADAIKGAAIGASSFSDWWAYKWEVYDAIPSNGAIMHDVGVVVSFNSDSDELARRMNAEAGKAVKYGKVPPAEAFKFVSLNPAKQLKIDSMTGSIEKGKDADIALWSGDPLSPTSRCVRTFVDGRELFSLEQDAAHRTRIASERSRILQKLLNDEPKKGGGGGGGPGGSKSESDAKPDADRPGVGADRPRRSQTPPPQDSMRSGAFLMVPAGGDDDETARAQAIFKARQIEARMEYLIRNGIDPSYGRPGVCGCDL